MFERRIAALAAALGAWLAGAGPAAAFEGPAPGAASAGTLKLPDKPASVRGLSDAASVNVFSGQLAYQIPVELPAGPAGFGPSLALQYSGELGNGPLGIGWTLGDISVRRSLRHGVPAYDDTDELDLIGIGAGGRLVRDPQIDGRFWVEGQGHTIRVDRKSPVSDNTVATIGRNILTGLASINLVTPGAPGPELTKIAPGEAYPVIPESESRELTAELDRFAATGARAFDSLDQLLNKENREAFAATLANLRQLSGALSQRVGKLDAVADALAAVVRTRPNALIVDFFAGSGTTLQATCMLNAIYGIRCSVAIVKGKRQPLHMIQ